MTGRAVLNQIKISARLFVVITIFVLTLAGSIGYFLSNYKNTLVEEHKDSLHSIVEISMGIVNHYYSLSQNNPEIGVEQAQEMAKKALRDLRYGDNDYIFVYTGDGVNLVTGTRQDLEGQNLYNKDFNGVLAIKELIETAKRGKGEYVEYFWTRGDDKTLYPKLSFSGYFEPWDWMIGTGVYVDDVNAKSKSALVEALLITLPAVLIASAISLLIAMSISKPLARMTEDMGKLANNDYGFEVKFTDYKDEVGMLARALSIFKGNALEMQRLRIEQEEAKKRQAEEQRNIMNRMADEFESKVGNIVEVVKKAAEGIEHMATQLSAGIEETSRQSTSVASASEEASTNVMTVAEAAEELSASIREISRNISDTAVTARQCAASAEMSKERLDHLQKATGEIDRVLQAIVEVAEQTNLLALNATIEAARAGDAGKGFAVVANEVKSLASKTHSMTDEISGLIEAIKNNTRTTVESVEDIIVQIDSVNMKSATVASSVEEQNQSTLEISRNIQEAAKGTSEVSVNIVGIQEAANDSARATTTLKDSASDLASQARELKLAVDKFIGEVRSS